MFVSLISTSMLAENKPRELVRASIIRDRLLELIGFECRQDSKEMFLLGLFSLIDAMLDQPLTTILKKIPLSAGINAALSEKSGDLCPFLRLVKTYKQGIWVPFRFALKKIGLDEQKVPDFYIEAIAWADSFE